jgi:peptidyl-prolyl cis-trans isomerase A (cyclophilin A)
MKVRTFAILASFVCLAACGKTEEPPPGSSAPATSALAGQAPPKPAPSAAMQEPSAPPAAAPAPTPSGPLASVVHPKLLDPANASEKAPAVFKAKFTTTKGDFVVEAHRDWAPNGADRFYNLVKLGFYDDIRFFRAVEGFMVQFGINGDPAVNAKWQEAGFDDDPFKQSNKRGFISFAQKGMPRTRTTQIFINLVDNARLDTMQVPFPAFAQVVQGMDVVEALFKGYGESPNQGFIQSQGNAYLDSKFPKLDGVKKAEIVK